MSIPENEKFCPWDSEAACHEWCALYDTENSCCTFVAATRALVQFTNLIGVMVAQPRPKISL